MSKTRLITGKEIRQIADRILSFLEKEDIDSVESLEKRLGSVFDVEGQRKHRVELELRPSNFGEEAYTISYVIPGKGIPIEVRMNPVGYSKIIVKSIIEMEGYKGFVKDPFGNVVQEKTIKFDFEDVKIELELLRFELSNKLLN